MNASRRSRVTLSRIFLRTPAPPQPTWRPSTRPQRTRSAGGTRCSEHTSGRLRWTRAVDRACNSGSGCVFVTGTPSRRRRGAASDTSRLAALVRPEARSASPSSTTSPPGSPRSANRGSFTPTMYRVPGPDAQAGTLRPARADAATVGLAVERRSDRLPPQDMPAERAVIAAACRTPIGALSGALASVPAPRLGATAIGEAVRRAGVAPEDVDEVFMGQVLTAGAGQAPARQAAIGAGLPEAVPCTTVNKVCGSGLQAVILAARAVLAGDAAIAVGRWHGEHVERPLPAVRRPPRLPLRPPAGRRQHDRRRALGRVQRLPHGGQPPS